MIIIGVILLILGAVLYYSGVEINNDMDAQMESFFNDGVTNPGSTYETIGIFLLIVGVLLIIVGIIRKVNENRSDNISQRKEAEVSLTEKNRQVLKKTCAYCGADLLDESVFCSHCGRENSNFVSCPSCGQRINADSLFCDFCGAEMLLFEFSLQNSSVEEIISSAFECLKSGDFKNANKLLDCADRKNPKNVQISLGKLLADYRLHSIEELADLKEDFGVKVHFHNIMSSDDEELKNQIRLYHTYSQACISMDKLDYTRAKELFSETGEWRDSKEKTEYCQQKIEQQNRKIEKERIEQLKAEKKKKLIAITVAVMVITGIILGVLCKTVIIPTVKYNKAFKLLHGENYVEAYDILTSIQGFKDVDEILEQFKALPQKELMTNGYGIQYHKHYTYDAVGNMTTKRVYGENSLSTIDDIECYAYNEKNDIIKIVNTTYDTQCEYEYEYDDAGVCLKEKETRSSGGWTKREHEYNPEGRLIKTKETGYLGELIITNYDYTSAGTCWKKTVYEWDGDGTIEEHSEYTYDDLGLCTKKTRNYYGDVSFGGGREGTNPIYTTDYYYDEKGNCIKQSTKLDYYVNEEKKSDMYTYTYTYEYNKKGELVQKTETTPEDGTITYEYSHFKIIYTEK